MSSAPIVRMLLPTLRGPTTRLATPSTSWAIAASLMHAGQQSVMVISGVTRNVAATPSTTARSRSSRRWRTTGSNTRSVPWSSTWFGMMLEAVPPWMLPIVSTAGSILEHALRSADALFGRLKDEQYRARQIGLARRQQLGDRQQDGGVAIMATGVVRALLNRAVGLAAIGLGERQSVDVRAQHHRAAGAGALQHPDDARLTYGCTHAMEPKLA